MSNEFNEFIERLKDEAEKAIKKELTKRSFFERIVFAGIMPLIVNIITDKGSCSLSFLNDGSIQYRKNPFPNPNNVIQADFETLKKLYSIRNKEQFFLAEREGKIRITSSGLKGQQAERKIRDLLSS
jgi:hypothetical protein